MGRDIDYETALLSPASVFTQPEDILTHESLPPQQKAEILRRWEYDESEIAVAVEEGIPDGESKLLRRITPRVEIARVCATDATFLRLHRNPPCTRLQNP